MYIGFKKLINTLYNVVHSHNKICVGFKLTVGYYLGVHNKAKVSDKINPLEIYILPLWLKYNFY